MNTQLIEIKSENSKLLFDKPGTYVVFFSNISGKISCKITSEKVELYMIGLYDIKNTDKYTIQTEQIHESPHSFSDLYILSLIKDISSFTFSGLIRIEKNAQHTHAYQKNQNVLLSKGGFVDSRPILEILADDVFCTHGSTTGPLSKDQLYYLQTKGLTKLAAEKASIDGLKSLVYNRLEKLKVKSRKLKAKKTHD